MDSVGLINLFCLFTRHRFFDLGVFKVEQKDCSWTVLPSSLVGTVHASYFSHFSLPSCTITDTSWVWARLFLLAHVTPSHSVSIIFTSTFSLTEYETKSWAQLSITTHHIYRLINRRLMPTVGTIDSSSNYCFVLMCQENHEPTFDASPVCQHRDATRPKAGLQALAFTPYFCLSNSISWLFHHTGALILCKRPS